MTHDIPAIIAAYSGGATYAQVGQQFGISESTARNIVRSHAPEQCRTAGQSQRRRGAGATYFTGTPCAKGHISPRYVSNNCCLACRKDYDLLHLEEHREAERRRSQKRRRITFGTPKAAREATIGLRVAPPPEVIAEAVRAYSAPRANPFADMLGEPPPGRSALDQKRMAGVCIT